MLGGEQSGGYLTLLRDDRAGRADADGTIWRIAYKGPSERAAAPDAKPQAAGRQSAERLRP